MTTHQLIRGGSLRSRSEEKDNTVSPRKISVDNTSSRDKNHVTSPPSRDGSVSRKRTLSRQNTLESFTLLPSPSENIKVYMSDGNMIKTVRVERTQTAWDLCLSLVMKSDLPICGNWTLVEQIVNNCCDKTKQRQNKPTKKDKRNEVMERTLEDHEIVIKVYKSWGSNSQNKLSLTNNKRKWQFLETPEMFFSSNVLDRVRGRTRDEIEEVLTEEYFSEKAPPVEGYLYFKDQKHNWSRKYFILRSSGLYYSTKGKSRAPQDLACFTTLQDMGIYFCVNAKVDHKSPTEHAISFKPGTGNTSMKDMKCVGAESEDDMMRWYHALRVVKYGDKIPENRASVLLEVTQEIERVHEQKKKARDDALKREQEEKRAKEEEIRAKEEEIRAKEEEEQLALELEKTIKDEEERKVQRLEVMSPKPDILKKPSPPPPSPKPTRSALQKPAPSPKPVPSPKPDLRKKMHLPVPPAKPSMSSPSSSRGSHPPTPQPIRPTPAPPPPTRAPPVYSLDPEPSSSKEFTPNKSGFADARNQLARSLNGTIKRGSVKQTPPPSAPKPITSPPPGALPIKAVPAQLQRQPPPISRLPDPIDDLPLPPPPPDLLPAPPTSPPVAAVKTDKPDINITPSRSKISEMVKNLNIPQKAPDKVVVDKAPVPETSSRNINELSSILNRTLKKSQTTSGLTNQPPVPQKSFNSTSMSNMPRSLTCPQMERVPPPSQPKPATQKPIPSSTVQDRAAELAKVLTGKQKQAPVLPAQSPYANQPPVPPPKQFSGVAPPAPRPFLQNNIPPQAFQQSSMSPQSRHPQSAPRANPPSAPRANPPQVPQSNLPPQPPVPVKPPGGPMRAPPPAVPPVANYTTPALPSRKDSLMASRNRTTSGSSGGSHGSSARAGSVASHASSQEPPSLVRPPPRTISRDNLRAGSRNGHRGSRENLAMNTATTVNNSSEHGIPEMFQRGGFPGGQPNPLLRDNSPHRQDPAPKHPLHFPPQRFNPPQAATRGRDSPARGGWHDSLMRDSSPVHQEAPREIPLPVSINDIRQVGQPGVHPRQFGGTPPPLIGNLNTRSGTCNPGSSGSGASEEVMYEYIEDVPSKTEHLQHWLANQYDDDTISVTSDNMMATPLTPPPRSNSRRQIAAPHTQKPWFHGCIPREAANALLASHGLTDGLFLVRSSATSNGDFVLSMTFGGQVKHFQITQRGGSPPWFAIEDGPCFPDINKLVDHYSVSADRLPAKLSCYCLKG
ncbi:ras-associated and pleckstrin homology domains-containing protein 1-like isoform X2 [Bolinopsis microptera]